MNQPLIFQHYPELRNNLHWIPLGQYPTPVERLKNLGRELALENLWIKRDDLSGELYGGNKVRTLEFSLAEAKQKQADLIFTYSALGSNWPLACVIYAKLHDLPTNVFFVPYPLDAIKEKNLALIHSLAHQVYLVKSKLALPFLLYSHLYRSKKNTKVYLMPPGGISPKTTLGYVNAVFELQRQCERGEMPIPDYIVCPLGTGGTAAGISIGLNLIGWPTQIIAVRVVDLIVANKFTLHYLIRKTMKTMLQKGANFSITSNWGNNIRIEHNYFGKGYSRPTILGEKSIELFRTHEHQVLDSTYTGKTFAAILEWCKQAGFKNKIILFWHTLNSRNLENLQKTLVDKRV
ncbi:MAG: 1-aminocyclopropane-1-carboxylate deaminase/D-cysteine desulfhydrase [bacterium]